MAFVIVTVEHSEYLLEGPGLNAAMPVAVFKKGLRENVWVDFRGDLAESRASIGFRRDGRG